MPSFILRNEQYRDEILKFSFPFDEQSRLENDEVFIGTDLIVDASLYFKSEETLPVHISSVDGTVGDLREARIYLSDSTGTVVGQADINYTDDIVPVISSDGVDVGVLVFYLPGLKRFIGRIAGKVYTLLQDVATFTLDVCSVTHAPYLRYIRAAEAALGPAVEIVARHGVDFRLDGDVISLNLLGDPISSVLEGRNPVRSINGVANRSIWLAAHPRLNLRIATKADGIEFISAGDAT
jgi:hypothetical protein